MSLKPEKNSFTFQNGLQTTTIFFYSIFLRANCEYHETKKRFFLKLIWTPEFCCTKKWACVQLLMAEQSDEILHVNITNFSRKLLNFCIIEWRWWVDKLDSLADSVSNIKKSQDLEEVLNWMIFYLQYIWQLNKHHDLTSIFFLKKKICMNFQCKILLGIWGFIGSHILGNNV